MFTLDNLFLLLTGSLAAYLGWYFYQRYTLNKALHNLYYLMDFAVLLVSGLLIGLGGIALAFISVGKQLFFFSPALVAIIVTPLLFLMTGAFTLGFAKRGSFDY